MWRAVADLVLTGKNEFRLSVNVNNGFPATPEGKAQKEQFALVIETLRQTPGIEAALAR